MPDATPKYAVEGAVFVAGAAVQWLRDGLHLFASAADVERLAKAADPDSAAVFVPGFVGLGAAHWVPAARGTIFGLTRATGIGELARAALEGVAFQVADLMAGMGAGEGELRVDGGMARNDWFLQFQADILGVPVVRAEQSESTALGAAFLAGLGCGAFASEADLRKLPSGGTTFTPATSAEAREAKLRTWRRAVKATIAYAEG